MSPACHKKAAWCSPRYAFREPRMGFACFRQRLAASDFFVNAAITLYGGVMTDMRESGAALDPKYDANGLVTAVVTDHRTGDVLMVAHMHAQALALTRETGIAHFWSRSRARLRSEEEHTSELQSIMRSSY